MKTILIYGDSNTWGQSSHLGGRYDYETRWVSKLKTLLGTGFDIVPAGLSGRIAGSYTNVEDIKRGKDAFEVVYRQTFPLDVAIIALGTNDLKDKYSISTAQIADDIEWYKKALEEWTDYAGKRLCSKVLCIAPPNFIEGLLEADEARRTDLNKQLQARFDNLLVLDEIDMSEDGVHFSEERHRQMAEAVYKKLKEMGL